MICVIGMYTNSNMDLNMYLVQVCNDDYKNASTVRLIIEPMTQWHNGVQRVLSRFPLA